MYTATSISLVFLLSLLALEPYITILSILLYFLPINLIEGDEIYLEYTTAKAVRGKNVTIGRGCNIELVEYVDNFNQHNDSFIRESKKIIL